MGADSWLGVELRHFLALEAVAREGSFGKAATALGYTQSAVSQQIATLERIVGHRLIDRPGGPKPVSLTEAGRLLLTHAGAIAARVAAAPLAQRDVAPTWRDLAELDLIGHKYCRSLAQLESDARRPLRFVFRSDHNQTVQALVASGVGSALVPRLTMDPEDEATELIELPRVQPRLISFAWHRDRYRTPAARAFVETARAVCADLELVPELVA